MNNTFTDEQLTHIRDQAMLYQCACPAQVCVAIEEIRNLYKLQVKCLDSSDTDRDVHMCIQISAEKSHAELEQCLSDILNLEGWNMDTLAMPLNLNKRFIDEL